MQLANALYQQFVIGWGTQVHCLELPNLLKLPFFAIKYALMRIVIFFDMPKIWVVSGVARQKGGGWWNVCQLGRTWNN
jgi:hypothetical protein